MQALTDIAPYLAAGAAAAAAVLLVLVIVLWIGLRRLRRAQLVVLGRHDQRDIVAEVVSLDSQVRNLREAVEILTDQLDEHKAQLDLALTNRAIVRYDAFRDAGGEQSASFALLDGYRSGVVFSAIAARDFARIYVKHLDHGVADRELSPEEVQAVAAAVPRPLARGEQGARAARAPIIVAPRRPLYDEPGPQEPAGAAQDELPFGPAAGPVLPAAPAAAPAAQRDADEARRAFDALADLGDGEALDEFTWESRVPPRQTQQERPQSPPQQPGGPPAAV